MSHHNPLFCVIPPYMLERIAEHGTEAQQARAKQALMLSEQMREQRQKVGARAEALRTAGPAVRQRSVHSAQFLSNLPGVLVRAEGAAPSGDPAVDEAYDGSGATYDLFWEVYQRNSIDGAGMPLVSTVHYQQGYDNAFWNGYQMVYGDGDEDLPEEDRIFNRFTISLDVIGHELTHGITQYTANLTYANQSGALNESFSDVFGSLVRQYQLRQSAAEADWIIGKGLFTANVNGVGLRSMKEPGTAYNDPILGKDPQPGHMRDYVTTTRDNGGVHINSGIPNHAFYYAAIEMGGYAWEKAGRIWYVTLRDRLRAGSTFQDAANLTYAVAGDLFGTNSLEQQAVKRAWSLVGIEITGDGGGNGNQNPGCLQAFLKLLRGT